MPMLVLCGCDNLPKNNNFVNTNNDRFVFVQKYTENEGEDDYSFKVLVDKETRVMYLLYDSNDGRYSIGGLTVMLNADGSPMLYEGEL